MKIIKKIFFIIIFSIFIGNNIFCVSYSKAQNVLSENVKINISKAKIIKN
jgi:hypothetical protein